MSFVKVIGGHGESSATTTVFSATVETVHVSCRSKRFEDICKVKNVVPHFQGFRQVDSR